MKNAGERTDIHIAARDVHRTFDLGEVRVEALKGLDVEVGRGEFLMILGPSGSGKMTLLNILGGIDSSVSGIVTVDGTDIGGYGERELSRYRREKVGWIFQFFNLIPSLSPWR